ncbi:MAG: pyridoxal-phosphate dependent enzyme [Rhizobiaceae bacterium]|nr:pyridoxal-phosphate dependent enzyme [Rhizobiaceae bacterium]
MGILKNGFRTSAQSVDVPSDIPYPSVDADVPAALLTDCPAHKQTPLVEKQDLAHAAGVAKVYLKDETGRMGLGSFKALGAAYVIAHHAGATGSEDLSTSLTRRTYVTASAGNHGLSVAAGARVFGAKAIIYLAETVPSAFADRLREKGAEVCVEGADYEASMAAALKRAEENGYTLLSDSSWDGYYELPHRLMEGYLVAAMEAVGQMPEPPTHIFLQAGVGGLAGAMAAYFRKAWGDGPVIVVVEPDKAPALQASIDAGKAVYADGPVSNMGRLDCKEPSLIALKGLAQDADYFLTVSDALAEETTNRLLQSGVASTPSGVGGLAGLFADHREELGLEAASQVLCIISEGAE